MDGRSTVYRLFDGTNSFVGKVLSTRAHIVLLTRPVLGLPTTALWDAVRLGAIVMQSIRHV